MKLLPCFRGQQVFSGRNAFVPITMILFCLLIAVSACAPEVQKGQVPTHVSTLLPTSSPVAQPTLRVPSPAPTIAVSATATQEMSKEAPCQQLVEKPLSQMKLTGQLVLKPRLQPPFLLDLSTRAQNSLTEDTGQSSELDDFATSPDGQWLAYTTFPPNPMVFLQSADGKQTKRIPEQWGRYIVLTGWLDNQHLVLLRVNDPNSFLTTVILDPFTGNWNEYRLEDLKNYPLSLGGTNVYFRSSNLMPDPSQTLIVYPQQPNLITLQNIETGQVLATLEDQGHFGHDPLWKIDGTEFVILISSRYDGHRTVDWFRVSNQGEVQQITNFKNRLDFIAMGNESRSPDGKQVAFWVSTQPDLENGKWAVLNLEAPSQLICIEGPEMLWKSPIWSPDSRYVVVANLDGDRTGPVMLIDTQEGWVTKVAEDAVPSGWLVQP